MNIEAVRNVVGTVRQTRRTEADTTGTAQRRLVYRHSVLVRVTHWVNVVCLTVLLMSGLQIFNAHAALYWGVRSDFEHPLFSITAEPSEDDPQRGITTILGHRFDTTGVLGVSHHAGRLLAQAFPPWVTLPDTPSLGGGRLRHFFFAWCLVLNGAVYLFTGVFGGHVRRDLLPSGQQLRHIGRAIIDHMMFRFPKGEAARQYNVLQKLTYLVVIFGLLPCMVLSGLTMSPRMTAAFPQLLSLFGGRQTARTIHFIVASSLVSFVLIHVFMVLVSGLWNNLRSMLTGRYAIEDARNAAE